MDDVQQARDSDAAGAVLPWRRVARVTIEFKSPFLIGSGRGGPMTDHMPVLDVNGLPALPGSSLAGVMRHAFAAVAGEARAAALFGSEDGHGSRLWVTWGHVHDAADVPVDGRLLRLPDDPVLASARDLVVRDHVRINHRGTAEDQLKFDAAVVPAGHRFTFDLTLETGPERTHDMGDFATVLGLLAGGFTRLGGAGRRGLGVFEVVRCRQGLFDLSDPHRARAFCDLPVSLAEEAVGLTDETLPAQETAAAKWHTLTLPLEAEDYWGFNGQEPWTADGESKAPDFNPVREERVVWPVWPATGRGRVLEPTLYAPGSSIKGALAHRVAFHHNVATRAFGADAPVGEQNEAVQTLFGTMNDRSDESGSKTARAGRIYIDDVAIPLGGAGSPTLQCIMHSSQDRFLGGVRRGILFEERCLYGGTLQIDIRAEALAEADQETPGALHALREALRDLAEGRLSLGAGGGRGHGYFRLQTEDFERRWHEFVEGGCGR